ncbi:F2RL1 [Mytilus coruscus]|uniref:F2RL1 n=1 Tax=Mytilus coruscus TaxID=42192 RepID=A0A6J8EZH7_MYTCO|nr:F2RL1 [Mytilus coruscus]
MKWVFIVALCITLFVVHVFAAVALAKTRELTKNRFFRLGLFLIISDACVMVEYAWHTLAMNTNNYNTDGAHQGQCLVLKHFIPAAIQSSLSLTILMCLQRLNATLRTPKQILKVLTSDIAIGLGFLFPHIYFLCRCILEFVDKTQRVQFPPCAPKYNTQKRFLLFADVPNSLFVAVIAICYVVVILRIIRNRRQVNVIGNLSDLQLQQKKKAALRMRYNIITLSCIIMVTACSMLPRTLYGLYTNLTGTTNEEIVRVTNNLLLLNPLVDPFIYIFSIKEVRRQLKCRCFQLIRTVPETTAIRQAHASTSVGMSNEQHKTARTS